jgi:DnaK suppressor protein
MSTNPTSADRAAQLRADRDHAAEQLARLEQEYDQALADDGMIQEDRDNLRTLLEAARKVAEEADAAVEQLAAGSYGTCQSCGGPIGAERLEALPGATMCVTCQAKA